MSFLKRLFSKHAPSTYQEQLHNFYKRKRYKNIPALPTEEESKSIVESSESFPASLVPKEYMKNIPGGLLRGDIVLLWWLNNPRTNKKRVPQYFLYDYGIDVDDQLQVLKEKHLINPDNTLTLEGKKRLDKHNQIIREHRAKKIYKPNGKVKYIFEDAESVRKEPNFVSTGDFVDDQAKGKAYEKAQDYDNAIEAYNSAYRLSLKDDLFSDGPPPNIFNRLAIIYRKQKDYHNEIKTLNKALKYYPDSEAFNKRLNRAKELNASK